MRWNSGVNQGPEKHVACDTGEAVKICNTHQWSLYELFAGTDSGAEAMADAGSTSFIEPER